MVNIHEILKGIGVEIPAEKKAEFDKAMTENYKTIAEVQKINAKLEVANSDLQTAKDTLQNMTAEFETFKQNNSSAEDFKKKYEDLLADNKRKEEAQQAAYEEAQERAEFDKYFTDNQKEWYSPMIADGYFTKFKEARKAEENKGKMTADILHELTKDDVTAFKGVTPDVKLKGASQLGGTESRMKELYKNNPFFKG